MEMFLDIFKKKYSKVKSKKYYFGEYIPIVIELNDNVLIKVNREPSMSFFINTKSGIETIVTDELIHNYKGKILVITKDYSTYYKVGDSTSEGIITSFPIQNRILKVEFDNSKLEDLDSLETIVTTIIKTEDGVNVYDIDIMLYVLDLSELRTTTLELNKVSVTQILEILFVYKDRYKIFRYKDNLKKFIETYLK